MTLYIYEHCPFCARVRYVAAVLNIPLNVVIVAYDDDTTTVDLIGAKQVPVLRKEDGECVAESLDIIDYLIELAGPSDHRKPSLAALKWQQAAFLPLQKLGYPRWAEMGLPDFSTESARWAWRIKKETEALNFDALLRDTDDIAKDVEGLIIEAKEILHLGGELQARLVDEALVFSLLRGFCSATAIQWDAAVKNWLLSASHNTNIPLLK
ncbi:GrxB family glutaredoxin [Vibrio sp. VPAP30]|uniref:GrxB family glutaredoxin n=1 Tax=Vibrio sp. VPAP30 TaxID=1647102 RepID=UPI000659BC9F|nr:GrxB family glutaredoxin [Vibrio sp. VPAP30]KLN65966.1 glutaredoxin [Vibrio sp. VPAP30]